MLVRKALEELSWFRCWWRAIPGQTRLLLWLAAMGGALSNVAYFVAMFLPLKALLLAATPDLPQYMAVFPISWGRIDWIVALAGFAVMLFVMAVALSLANGHFIGKASSLILIRVTPQEKLRLAGYPRLVRRLARSNVELMANAVIIALGAGALVFTAPECFAVLLVVIWLECMLSELCLVHGARGIRRYIAVRIRRNPGRYVQILAAGSFFVAFGALLWSVLITESLGLIGAIFSVLVVRRWLHACQGSIQAMLRAGTLRETLRSRDAAFERKHRPTVSAAR